MEMVQASSPPVSQRPPYSSWTMKPPAPEGPTLRLPLPPALDGGAAPKESDSPPAVDVIPVPLRWRPQAEGAGLG